MKLQIKKRTAIMKLSPYGIDRLKVLLGLTVMNEGVTDGTRKDVYDIIQKLNVMKQCLDKLVRISA